MNNRKLITLFLIVFIDLLGFSIILPLLPFYAESFNATPTQIGFLVASYAAAQLVGAPLLGRLSDRFGRKPVLLISLTGTLIGFLILGFANSLWMLFLSRILDGFTGGNISVAQAYITDVTDESNRAKGLGLLGAAFGLGFIIGPAAGGLLSVYGFALPAFVAAGFSMISILGVLFFLPESLTEEARADLEKQERQSFSLKNLWQALNRPRVGPILHVRFFYGLAFAIFQTIFPLYALYRFDLDARSTGFVLTYVGILVVFVQGFLVGWLASHFDEYRLIFLATVIMGLSLFAWAIVPNVAALLMVLAPLAFAAGILNTLLNSTLSKAVYAEEVGGTLGLSASLESLTRVISPSAGGYLLGSIGAWAPGLAGGLIMIWTVSYAWRRLIRNPDPPLPPRKLNETLSKPEVV
ncbi:MAG: MFS transporter [Anaerolineales bacterium]|jgi:DHA1 family tetracycline resistance protein-like MFS transporter